MLGRTAATATAGLSQRREIRRHLKWVPLAYRGAPTDRERERDPSSSSYYNNYKNGETTTTTTNGGGNRRRAGQPPPPLPRRRHHRANNNAAKWTKKPAPPSSYTSSFRKPQQPRQQGQDDEEATRALQGQRRRSRGQQRRRREHRQQEIRRLEEDLRGLQDDLVRLCKNYRGAFLFTNDDVDAAATRGSSSFERNSSSDLLSKKIRIGYVDANERRRAEIRTSAARIRTLFGDVHADVAVVDWRRSIVDTETTFRNLCRALQDVVRVAAELYRLENDIDDTGDVDGVDDDDDDEDNNDDDGSGDSGTASNGRSTTATGSTGASRELIGLAEAGLAALVKLRSDRSLVVESTKTWGQQRLSSSSSDSTSAAAASSSSPFQAFINTVRRHLGEYDRAAQRGQDEDQDDQDGDDDDEKIGPTAHADPDLGVTQRLFSVVIDAVVSHANAEAEKSSSSSAADPDEEANRRRNVYEQASRRMIALLDVMPSSWLPDTAIVQQIMEMLCRAGFLESARACHLTFMRHPINHHRLRFSLVLQAYLEAVQREPDDEKVLLAVQEAIGALHGEWNDNLPKNQFERVVHGSFVLNCLCAAEHRGVSVPGGKASAEFIVKRTMSGEAYGALQDQLHSDKPAVVDTRVLPLIHRLAQLYTMGEDPNFEHARRLLSCIIQHDRQEGGKFMILPMVDTFNAVLLSSVLEYERGEKKPSKLKLHDQHQKGQVEEHDDITKTLDYANSLLQFMLSVRDTSFWPNEETFTLLFRLLSATKPKDIGQRAENILDKLEIRRAISSDDDYGGSGVQISLSIYHRVLRCWLEAAKGDDAAHGKISAERALRILDKIEIQSMPFLMSDQEVLIQSRPFYDIKLRPSRRTYRLVQQICLHAMDHRDDEDGANQNSAALAVAFAVYEKLLAREMVAAGGGTGIGSDYDILAQCVAKIPAESAEREAAEARLESYRFDDDEYRGGGDDQAAEVASAR